MSPQSISQKIKSKYAIHLIRVILLRTLEDDMEMPTAVPNLSTHQPATHSVSLKTPAPPADQQLFFPEPIGRLEALMFKENRTLTLMKVGMEEASTRFDTPASQDEASYDGDVSDAGEDDIKVVPDEVDATQVKVQSQ